MIAKGRPQIWISFLQRRNAWFKKHEGKIQKDIGERPFVKPYVVIIGTLDLPQCKKYRVIQKIEQLSLLGIRAYGCSVYDVPHTLDAMQFASSIILYRLSKNSYVDNFIQEAKRLNLPIGYDIDDPIFSHEIYKDNKNLDFLNPVEKKQLLDSSHGYLAVLKKCDFATVSTPKMKDVVAMHFKQPIFLWRNVIDGETYHIVKNLSVGDAKNSGDIYLGYMSGSRAHEYDFEQIITPITKLMRDHHNVYLKMGGHTNIPKQFDAYKERIVTMPFTGYHGYLNYLNNIDINLVPLVKDEFNDCKSAIRFLEASMVGKPTVASKIGDFTNIIEDKATGYLVQNAEDWYSVIKELIESKELREKIGNNARKYVIENQSNESFVKSMDKHLQIILAGSNGKTAFDN